jgi:hypothetical protein
MNFCVFYWASMCALFVPPPDIVGRMMESNFALYKGWTDTLVAQTPQPKVWQVAANDDEFRFLHSVM